VHPPPSFLFDFNIPLVLCFHCSRMFWLCAVWVNNWLVDPSSNWGKGQYNFQFEIEKDFSLLRIYIAFLQIIEEIGLGLWCDVVCCPMIRRISNLTHFNLLCYFKIWNCAQTTPSFKIPAISLLFITQIVNFVDLSIEYWNVDGKYAENK